MTSDESASAGFCQQCGRPLIDRERQAGYICADCRSDRNEKGLLPGAAWLAPTSRWQGESLAPEPDTTQSASSPGAEVRAETASASDLNASNLSHDPGGVASTPAVSGLANESASLADQEPRSNSQAGDDGKSSGGAEDDGVSWPLTDEGGPEVANHGSDAGSGAGGGPSEPQAALPPAGDHETLARQYWPYPPPESLQPPDPDRPPWRWPTGLGVWLVSVAAIVVVPIIAILIYVIYEKVIGAHVPPFDQAHQKELLQFLQAPPAVLVQVLATLVAHLLTIVVIWAVVTRFGRRPLFETLGFQWRPSELLFTWGVAGGALVLLAIDGLVWAGFIEGVREAGKGSRGALAAAFVFLLAFHLIAIFAAWASITGMGRRPTGQSLTAWLLGAVWLQKILFIAGVVVAMIVVEIILSNLLPESRETVFDKLLKTSQSVRIAVAALAVLTAPIVEEGVYRGVLFSGIRRHLGLWSTVLIVALCFTIVHFPQYWGSWAALLTIMTLSFSLTVIRAKTKSILPCIVVHTLFNAVSSIGILLHGGK